MRKALWIGLAIAAVTACAKPVVTVSDEQLINLLADVGDPIDVPFIDAKVTKCISLIAGLSDAVHSGEIADHPGLRKIGCRRKIQEILDDPERNSGQLVLAIFEDKEVGQRVVALSDKLSEKFIAGAGMRYQERARTKAQAREAAEPKAQQERIAALEEELGSVKKAARAYYNSDALIAMFEEMTLLCNEWRFVRHTAQESVRDVRWSWLPLICNETIQAKALKSAPAYLAELEAATVDPSGIVGGGPQIRWPPITSSIQPVTKTAVESARIRLREEIAEMRALLAGTRQAQ